MRELGILLLFMCFIPTPIGYKLGAPATTCSHMTPQHGVNPQSTPSPFKVSAQPRNIRPGDEIKVSLISPEGKHFKGFMIQVRRKDNFQTIGKFKNADGMNFLDCFEKSASGVTHVNNDEKSEIVATWISPSDYQGRVVVYATAVENGEKFWVNVTSDDIEISGPTGTSPDETTPFREVYDGCYTTKGCFGGPDGCISTRNCKLVVTYKAGTNSIDFEMVGEILKGWIAVGFSEDNLMGEDAVTACAINNNRVDVYQSWNEPNPKTNVPLSNLQQGLSKIATSDTDGFIKCQFTHEADHTVLNQYKFHLLNESYYLFLGRGPMVAPNQMARHLQNPYISADAALLTDVSEIGLASDLLIKLHGSFMVAAWVGTVSVAIFLARYFKNMWPNSKHCGQQIWFTWHRALNILTLLLTAVAFVLIFVQFNGWSPVLKDWNVHPILGIIVMILTIVQPIMAMCRCHPGTPKRPIFNWLHFLVGNIAHVLAVITMFFAKPLSKAKLPDFYMWILISFVAFHVIVFFVMEIFTCFHGNKVKDRPIALKDLSNGNAFTMTAAEVSKNVGSRFRKVLLLLYVFGNVGFSIALIITITMSPVKER